MEKWKDAWKTSSRKDQELKITGETPRSKDEELKTTRMTDMEDITITKQ